MMECASVTVDRRAPSRLVLTVASFCRTVFRPVTLDTGRRLLASFRKSARPLSSLHSRLGGLASFHENARPLTTLNTRSSGMGSFRKSARRLSTLGDTPRLRGRNTLDGIAPRHVGG